MLTAFAALPIEDWVLRGAALIGGCGVLWGVGVMGLKAVRGLMGTIRGAINMARSVQKIAAELAPNGGSTIRDSIDRIEVRTNNIEARIDLSDQRLRVLNTDSPLGQFEADENGDNYWVNRTYATMLGRDISQLKGSGWLSAVLEEDRSRACEEWESAVKDKRECDLTYRMVNAQTAVAFPVRVHTYPMMDHTGKLLAFFGTVTPEPDRACV